MMDRPMNEYENALCSGITVLIKAVIAAGVDRSLLAADFQQSAQDSKDDSRASGAAVLEMFSRAATGDVAYVPNPPFGVIDGGKKD